MADEALYIAGTQIHPAVTPTTYGTTNVLSVGWGSPAVDVFTQSRPLLDGKIYLGQVAGERRFPIRLINHLGENSRPKGYKNWEDLGTLFDPDLGLQELKHVRDDPAGGSASRVLRVVAITTPAPLYVAGGGEPGIRPNGNILYECDLLAPFPYWRNATASTAQITTSGTSPGSAVLTRSGQLVCGLKITVTTSGTLGSITLSDGTNSITLTATFGAVGKYLDWYSTDPTAVSSTSGLVISTGGYIALHAASTTITATPGGGSSGNHTIDLEWYPVWRTV